MADFSAFRRAYPKDAKVTSEAAADGWPLRVFRWPAKHPRGSILFQGGRGDIIEKYLESFAHWQAQGWSVTAFDWRGQGGSGRFTADPLTGHVPDFKIWVEDLAAFVTTWSASSPGPHVAIGHSMGGHLILRALAEQRVELDAAVLVAPMLGFETGAMPVSLAVWLVRAAAWLAPERRAWQSNERPGAGRLSRQLFLTGDEGRYADELWWKGEQPGLALGPPSLKWLEQAHRSCQALETRLDAITTPLLLLGAKGDRLVSPAAIERFAGKLPNARLRMFGDDVAHEILREREAVRSEALAEIDRFLGEARARG